MSAAVLAVGLGACGGDAPQAAAPPSGYTLALEPPELTVGQGREAWLSVSVTRDAGFDGAIEVTLNQPPAGVTAGTLVLSPGIDSGPLPIRLAADLPEGSVLVLDVKASSGEVRHSAASTLTVSLPKPYAQTAIAAALKAGSIDYGTSLLYRAYALFGDARLPDAYLGAGSVEEDNLVFEEIRLRLAEFPPERQAELRAFIVRPTDALSVWTRGSTASGSGQPARMNAASSGAQAARGRPGRAALPPESCATLADGAWVSKLSSKFNKLSSEYNVRVWMQCGPAPIDDAVVQRVIDGTLAVLEKIYVPMTDVLGPPRSDLAEGGDGAIDFYIVHDSGSVRRRGKDFTPKGNAVTYNSLPIVGTGASAFVLLPRSTLTQRTAHTTIIHDFFHVLQNAHNALLYEDGCAGDKCKLHWFIEASAAWAGAHFDRMLWTTDRAAYDASYFRFVRVFQPSVAALNATDNGSQHDYSAFIWPYFVEQETKGTAFMKQIWNGLDGVKTFEAADDVINAAYPFALNFPRFAVRNLNNEFTPGDPLPESERYVSLDPAQFVVADNQEPIYLPGDLVAGRAYSQLLILANLSARYVKLTVKGTNIGNVEIDTGGLAPGGSLVTQALILTAKGWVAKPVELVNGKTVFCFDRGPSTEAVRGSFEQIVLVLSNHALRKGDEIIGELKAMPTATPCGRWEGTIGQVGHILTGQGGTATVTSHVSAVFEFDDANKSSGGGIPFRLQSGTYNYEELWNNPGCRTIVMASGALPLNDYRPLVPSGGAANLNIDPLSLEYSGSGLSVITVTETTNCNDRHEDVVTVNPRFTMVWWNEPAPGPISKDGKSIRNMYTTNFVTFDIALDKTR